MIQKLTIDNKFTVTIYDPQTLWIETLKPYPDIRHMEYQIELTDLIFGDNEPTRYYAIAKYKEILRAIDMVKKHHFEYIVLYDMYEKIERQIWCEIESKSFNGANGRKAYSDKVRHALRFFYNDLYRSLFSIEGDVESSPDYIQPYLLSQILTALKKD